MRIGQVTMYGDNYGACLQAFALQKILERQGIDVYILKYNQHDRNQNTKYLKVIKAREIGIWGLLKYLKDYKFIRLKKQAFNDFREKYLKFYDIEFFRNDDLNVLNDYFDRLICGSDMIWSEEFSSDWDFYFLKFAQKEKSYSYAPSFGRNTLSEENQKIVKNYLNHFQLISCRENGGLELISTLQVVNAIQVIDPTMLLTKEEWDYYISNKNRIINSTYVFAYIFGKIDRERSSFFAAITRQLGQVKFLPRLKKKELASLPITAIGPMDYLRLFRDASFIVTDTFHGLMFSLIFQKPFLVLRRTDNSIWSKYGDRMTSTLEMFGVPERYVDSSFRDFDTLKSLDYAKLEKIINEKRINSFNYINRIIKGSADCEY